MYVCCPSVNHETTTTKSTSFSTNREREKKENVPLGDLKTKTLSCSIIYLLSWFDIKQKIISCFFFFPFLTLSL